MKAPHENAVFVWQLLVYSLRRHTGVPWSFTSFCQRRKNTYTLWLRDYFSFRPSFNRRVVLNNLFGCVGSTYYSRQWYMELANYTPDTHCDHLSLKTAATYTCLWHYLRRKNHEVIDIDSNYFVRAESFFAPKRQMAWLKKGQKLPSTCLQFWIYGTLVILPPSG